MSYFAPNSPPKDMMEVWTEQKKLQEALNNPLPFVKLDLTTVAPKKPRDGQIVYADGVLWKPNGTGGRGYWGFRVDTGLWVQLG